MKRYNINYKTEKLHNNNNIIANISYYYKLSITIITYYNPLYLTHPLRLKDIRSINLIIPFTIDHSI